MVIDMFVNNILDVEWYFSQCDLFTNNFRPPWIPLLEYSIEFIYHPFQSWRVKVFIIQNSFKNTKLKGLYNLWLPNKLWYNGKVRIMIMFIVHEIMIKFPFILLT